MPNIPNGSTVVQDEPAHAPEKGTWTPDSWERSLDLRERTFLETSREIGKVLDEEIIAKIPAVPHSPESRWTPGGWERALSSRERTFLNTTREIGRVLQEEIIAKIAAPEPK